MLVCVCVRVCECMSVSERRVKVVPVVVVQVGTGFVLLCNPDLKSAWYERSVNNPTLHSRIP